ncbi:hypothetical protein M9Y10_001338 [Tritrichomonas musculus]|uniref:TPR Domain containing protein n=1 Tax=Tritrichomonas musculus TaxID=1915356 RepID=A0ABR2L7R7_9EUKA
MNNVTLDCAFGPHTDEVLKQMQDRKEYEGDNDYVEYPLPPLISTERMFSSVQEGMTPEKERAFTIAHKARTAMERGNYRDADKMAYHALSIDPLCVDAWRVFCNYMNQICEGDTVICAIRELIHFSRQFYKKEFDECDGMFYSVSYTRPYIRLLSDIAITAFQSDQLDVTIRAYEEIIRLNIHDNTGARNPLLACYLKIIGRIRRIPSTRPIRTIQQAEQLMTGQIDSETESIFEDGNLTVRWAKLCIAYLQNKNWKDIAKEEYEKNDLIFKVIFNDIDVSQIQPEDPNHPESYVEGSKSEEVRALGGMIKQAMRDWPDFVIELCKLLKGKVTQQFIEQVESETPDPESELTTEHKEQMKMIAQHFLDQGRTTLSNRQFDQAIQCFTFAKRGYFESAQPSRRFYLHAPFAVVSNRATAAAYMNMWNLVRIDTRYTLAMKPDHAKSYLRLPKIAEGFKAKQLYEIFQNIAQKVESASVKEDEEWKNLAKIAIGLTSVTAIAFAAAGILTEEKKEELIQTGIEDCFCPVNVGVEYPLLPWLNPSDIEQPIPNF